jgi:hypothetical protein
MRRLERYKTGSPGNRFRGILYEYSQCDGAAQEYRAEAQQQVAANIECRGQPLAARQQVFGFEFKVETW